MSVCTVLLHQHSLYCIPPSSPLLCTDIVPLPSVIPPLEHLATPALSGSFWVRPCERMVRVWCRLYSTHLDEQDTYLPWVVEEFSGILCVDEVYQGKLALLLAVDPAAPTGDRLVGYELVQGTVDRAAMAAFLDRLKEAGLCPEEVITDGSSLYPSLVAEIWPTAAHQLCLFHETRRGRAGAGL